MPRRPPRHSAPRPPQPSGRAKTADRGYGARWRKAALAWLAAHPYCVLCFALGVTREANVVDHVVPHRGDQRLFWDQGNWQALCKPCHDLKTGGGQ